MNESSLENEEDSREMNKYVNTLKDENEGGFERIHVV